MGTSELCAAEEMLLPFYLTCRMKAATAFERRGLEKTLTCGAGTAAGDYDLRVMRVERQGVLAATDVPGRSC